MMHMSTKTKMLCMSGRQESRKSRQSMFGALVMAKSHAGLHHHSSWIDISAKWARTDFVWPELLSFSMMDQCAMVCLGMSFPFLQSFDV